jgi:hypothetical protein
MVNNAKLDCDWLFFNLLTSDDSFIIQVYQIMEETILDASSQGCPTGVDI